MAFFQRVDIIESEAGWGSKVDDVEYFTSIEKAKDYIEKYNAKYNPPQAQVPGWYMYASLGSIVQLTEEQAAKIKVDPEVH